MTKQLFEMTEDDLETLLDASKPTPAMYLSGGIPMAGTPQENANRAWKALGRKMGFDAMTVEPVPGRGERFFMAEASDDGYGFVKPKSVRRYVCKPKETSENDPRVEIAAADRAVLGGAPELAEALLHHASEILYAERDGRVYVPACIDLEQAAATLAAQAAEIARLREVARAARRLMDLPADASMEDGAIADSALRDALAALTAQAAEIARLRDALEQIESVKVTDAHEAPDIHGTMVLARLLARAALETK